MLLLYATIYEPVFLHLHMQQRSYMLARSDYDVNASCVLQHKRRVSIANTARSDPLAC